VYVPRIVYSDTITEEPDPDDVPATTSYLEPTEIEAIIAADCQLGVTRASSRVTASMIASDISTTSSARCLLTVFERISHAR